jgi:cardiolipin synthase (CMP-forming)
LIDSWKPFGFFNEKNMASRTLTPANQITILRLVFVPLFAIFEVNRDYGWALAILLGAAFSDVVDGLVARIFHEESPLGIALDPIADKLLLGTAFVVLAFRDVLPWWLTILVLSRDVAIIVTALLISLVVGYRPFRPTVLGKISTVCQVATVFAAVAFQVHVPLVTSFVLEVCTYLVAVFTVASGVHYLLVVQRRYGHHAQDDSPAGPSQH